jgi:cation diffusion facilitator family transporter
MSTRPAGAPTGAAAAPAPPSTPAFEVTRAAVRRVLWITLILNVLVSVGKIVVGRLTGSIAMEADGFHSLTDGANNIVGLVITTFAYAPPDSGHPYGHRKFETAAALFIGFALLTVAFRVVEQALAHVGHPQLPEVGLASWAVMGTTIACNLFIAWYENREGRRLGSEYLQADAAHTRSDIYVSLGVVASFAGASAGAAWVDPVVAVVIAGFIAVLAVKILTGSFHVLTDRAVLPAEALAPLVMAIPEVRACREIRSRGGRDAVWVDLIVHVDGGMTLRDAHDVADRIEQALIQAHPEIMDVVVHLEPAAGS